MEVLKVPFIFLFFDDLSLHVRAGPLRRKVLGPRRCRHPVSVNAILAAIRDLRLNSAGLYFSHTLTPSGGWESVRWLSRQSLGSGWLYLYHVASHTALDQVSCRQGGKQAWAVVLEIGAVPPRSLSGLPGPTCGCHHPAPGHSESQAQVG